MATADFCQAESAESYWEKRSVSIEIVGLRRSGGSVGSKKKNELKKGKASLATDEWWSGLAAAGLRLG